MPAEQIRSFEEFWPYYVRAHANKGNRLLHFVGTSTAIACAAGALLLSRPKLALLAPLAGYGAAWIGHFGVEKNVPATFGHPLWSLKADFVMWSKIISGTMDAEVERVLAEADEADEATDDAGPGRVDVTTGGGHTDRYAVN
jgi:hypothetical protein